MSTLTIILLAALAVLAVAFLAWLFMSGPDDEALDETNKSAMPYDSMYVQDVDEERRR